MSGSRPAAIVTGGGWNIGRAIALDLANAGHAVTVAARTVERLEETAALVRAAGGDVLVVPTDVTSVESTERLIGATVEAFGRIDALVNIAGGFGAEGTVDTVDPAEWIGVLQRNVVGSFLCTRAALPQLKRQSRANVINCAGAGAFFPQLGWPITAYATSKAALCRFTDQLAAELLETNIRVNCIEPGMVWDPPMLAQVEAEERASGEPHPMRSHNRPPEAAAELVRWLVSDAAAEINGRLISVNDDWWRDPETTAAVAAGDAYRLRRTSL